MLNRSLPLLSLSALFVASLISCGNNKNTGTEEKPTVADSASYPDTLRVGTLYSPTSFFLFRGDTMGYEYERIEHFARDKHLPVKYNVAKNLPSLIEMLKAGAIDVIAYEVPVTAEYKEQVLSCGEENITYQVLVQPKNSDSIVTDVTQLVGRTVWVEKGSKYESRLRNLDNEVGGGIKIVPISEDSIIADDLVEQVAEGKISLTIVDSDIAKLNTTYYNDIDVSLDVSFPQRAAWAVNKNAKWLADSINAWSNSREVRTSNKSVLKRYFEMSKNGFRNESKLSFDSIFSASKGIISPYDEFFKSSAKEINWDWRLLAAMGWVESQFNPNAVSWAGARGVMQMMPRTASAFGLNEETIVIPEHNIKAAAKCVKAIENIFSKYVSNPTERRKFVLAAYNSGSGHILDAIALAKKYGKDPTLWEGNVEEALMWKANPEYFNDEVCHSGYFRSKETVEYVQKVNRYYTVYKSKIKL